MMRPYAATTPRSGCHARSVVGNLRRLQAIRLEHRNRRVPRASALTGASRDLLSAAARPIGLGNDARHRCERNRAGGCSVGTAKLRRPEEHHYHLPARDSFLILRTIRSFCSPRRRSTKTRAFEVIHLVLEAAGQQSGAFDDLLLAVAVQPFDDRARRARERGVEAGHAEAAFFLELHAVALDEFRIDEREQIGRIAADRDVGDENPQRHADLRGREADARRRIHRLDHVVDEAAGCRG